MKKILVMLTITFVICGAAWGQSPTRTATRSLLIGGQITFSRYTSITTDEASYENTAANAQTANSKTTRIQTQYAPSSTGLYLGAVFNFTPNVAFEAMTAVNGGNTISVFGTTAATNSVSYFSSILVSIKY